MYTQVVQATQTSIEADSDFRIIDLPAMGVACE